MSESEDDLDPAPMSNLLPLTPSELIRQLTRMTSGKLTLLNQHPNYRYILQRVIAAFNVGSGAVHNGLQDDENEDENEREFDFEDEFDFDKVEIKGAKVVREEISVE